jgi:hypothetical protein
MWDCNNKLVPIHPDVQDTLSEALERSHSNIAVALLLEAVGCQNEHVWYMSGPVVVCLKQDRDVLPPWWLLHAVYKARLARIFDEIRDGQIGGEAEPIEVLAYVHPALGKLLPGWADLAQEVVLANERLGPDKLWEVLVSVHKEAELLLPSPNDSSRYDQLTRRIRVETVKIAAERKRGKQWVSERAGLLSQAPLPYLLSSNEGQEVEADFLLDNLYRHMAPQLCMTKN